MPDREGPEKRTLKAIGDEFQPNPRAPFVELGLMSPFSFLRGASDAVDMAVRALELGYDALGIADINTMAGVVRHHVELSTAKVRPVIGCRIETTEGLAFFAYPETRAAYGRLCALISAGRMATPEGDWQDKDVCQISLAMLERHAEGVHLVLLPPADWEERFAIETLPQPDDGEEGSTLRLVHSAPLTGTIETLLPHLAARLPSMRHIAAAWLYRGDDIARINRLDALARANGLAILATNDVHYSAPDRRPLQDVMTCIREKVLLKDAGYLLHANAERHLKSPQEMVRLFALWPHAITAARDLADACTFALTELHYEYPEDPVPHGRDADEHLADLAWAGAQAHYPGGVPAKVAALIDKELVLIGKMKIARYFLTIKDIVDFARSREPPILCQGRGSAANSAVCFCLGITGVNPAEHELLIERFISEERSEPPDIDVDFEHERREEVIQYLYRRYGRHRAGLCATVIHYRPRSAIREVGKVMGLSEDVTAALAGTIWGSWGSEVEEKRVGEAGLDLGDPQLRRVLKLADQLIGMPRHLSQHVGGFILTEGPLSETVPIGNGAMPERSFIEWDKDDIDALGILKVDVLALGMLSCIRKAFDLIDAHHEHRFTLADVPREDDAVYDMLCRADSIGVFQVESRAQMNMLPRLRPRQFYDLVIEVAIVRPGPIQGDMVHPYLKRRSGKEVVEFPSPSPEHGEPDELENILKRTLGVPIFQEQAMKIALDAARFTPEEANQLRKAMATFRSRGMVDAHQDKMVGRMIARGYDPEFAHRCFDQIKGFGEYGFPESHAASFAHLVYISSWIKCHYPDVFCAALLNAQPMGFYAPAQIVRDAREHGVEVRAADVNESGWDNALEAEPKSPAREKRDTTWSPPTHLHPMRLGFRQIDGLKQPDMERLVEERQRAPFASVADLRERTGLGVPVLQRLAEADAFRSIGLDRRQALWEVRALKNVPDLPLFAAAAARDEGQERSAAALPAMPLPEHVVADYQTTRLSLKAHPLSFLRADYARRGFTRNDALKTVRSGRRVKVAGVVLIRQRPGSAKGVCFITLEDETGVSNLVIWPSVMEEYRRIIMGARLMEVEGRIQRDEKQDKRNDAPDVLHVVVDKLTDGTDRLLSLSEDLLSPRVARADHVKAPLPASVGIRRHPRNVSVLPKSRDFH
ncbi:error-prone DNA polymerase [Novosphingopyxis sp. YJ-S2-01]|uniref:error-prone DNA polymerase n=1 Tax=Novosphingopyxis sp. YJ-S2-01 TaxID=2794021 RepID=UPI0018DC53E4|nr:error-prone DNA polymerase [Novosphingopyxis sp. YJ-S2-01]MBH9536399.1 error-prone DNA polymerase [Novosphingopyxis sp. YJ-S2-01]